MKIQALTLLIISSTFSFSQNGWRKVTDGSNGISQYNPIQGYAGAAFVDINNDGYIDIFTAPQHYYINNGNAFFSSAQSLPYSPINTATGTSWADLNNDGFIDCIVAGYPTTIFMNNGLGGFVNQSMSVIPLNNFNSFGCAIGDLNGDAKLDFVFAHANGFHPSPSPSKLFKQTGTQFDPKLLTGYHFTDKLSTYTNPFWSDFDLDGDMDLFIASGPANGSAQPDFCYKNMLEETGKDTLLQMTNELFAAENQDGQCYNFIDYDNDQDLDLCLTNYYGAPTRLYKNTGAGVYTSINTPFTFASTNLTNCWGDYDNDGDLDVIISNDNQITNYYENHGQDTFIYQSSGFTTGRVSGIINGDADNDGDLDLFVSGIGNNGQASSCGLYINETLGQQRNWINIALEGYPSNASAIGARIQVKASIKGNTTWQMREVNAQNSFQGQNDLRAHFGLDTAKVIETLVIIWPSGYEEKYLNINPNHFYTFVERNGYTILSTPEYSSQMRVKLYPNPTKNYISVELTSSQLSEGSYIIYDVSGKDLLHGKLQGNPTIDVSTLSNGVYVVHLIAEQQSYTSKFMVDGKS